MGGFLGINRAVIHEENRANYPFKRKLYFTVQNGRNIYRGGGGGGGCNFLIFFFWGGGLGGGGVQILISIETYITCDFSGGGGGGGSGPPIPLWIRAWVRNK